MRAVRYLSAISAIDSTRIHPTKECSEGAANRASKSPDSDDPNSDLSSEAPNSPSALLPTGSSAGTTPLSTAPPRKSTPASRVRYSREATRP